MQALPGQTTPEGVPAFKLVLVGDGGTGTSGLHCRRLVESSCKCWVPNAFVTLLMVPVKHPLLHAGKTTFVKRHLTGEFEKKYEREICAHLQPDTGNVWTQLVVGTRLWSDQACQPMRGDMSMPVLLQLPLGWRYILWTSQQTEGSCASSAGIQRGKKSLAGSVMATTFMGSARSSCLM